MASSYLPALKASTPLFSWSRAFNLSQPVSENIMATITAASTGRRAIRFIFLSFSFESSPGLSRLVSPRGWKRREASDPANPSHLLMLQHFHFYALPKLLDREAFRKKKPPCMTAQRQIVN